MKKLIGLAVVMAAAMSLLGETSVVTNDNTLTVTVAEDETYTLTDAIGENITKFIKTGKGKLTLGKDALWSDLAGEVEVQQGTLAVGAYSYMKAPSKVTVSDGATIDFSGIISPTTGADIPRQKAYLNTEFCVTGNGYNGAGAMRRVATDGNAISQSLIKHLTLNGDTKIVGKTYANTVDISQEQGWGLGQYASQGTTPTFDMNGKTLTIEGSFTLGNCGTANSVNLKNPGNIVLSDSARMIIPSIATLTVSGTGATSWPTLGNHTITLGNNSKMLVYMFREAKTLSSFKVVVPEDKYAYYYQLANNDNSRGYIYMPFEINGTLSVRHYVGCTHPLRFMSAITGKGKFHHYSQASEAYKLVETRIDQKDTISVGDFSVEVGPVSITNAGNVAMGQVNVTGGSLGLYHSTCTSTGNVAVTGGSLNVITGVCMTAGAITKSGGVFDVDAGNCVTAQQLKVTSGALNLDGSSMSVTNFYVDGGNTLYGSAATVIGSAAATTVDGVARLRLKNGAHFDGGKYGAVSDHAIMVGYDKFGILDVSGGSTVSNMIYMARQNGDYGAVHLSGDKSEIYWASTGQNRSLIGDIGYGCMMMSGGKVIMPKGYMVLLGRNGGSGYWYQSGGTTAVEEANFWLGRPYGDSGSTADLHVQGGTFTVDNNIVVLNPDEGADWKNCRAVMTVGGGTTASTIKAKAIAMYCTTNKYGSVMMVNINKNGTLETETMYRAAPISLAPTINNGDYSRTHIYMNFNGGTLKFDREITEFFASEKQAPTSVVVYEGGAKFNTAEHNVGFIAALQKPSGKGIKSVTLPEASKMEVNGHKYVGTARLYSDNNETFAALTDFDTTELSATGAIVTCPGNNVSDSAVVKVLTSLRSTAECTATLETLSTTGGVTKVGAGTLTLKGANTYGGTTRVEAGAMVFTNANGYPGGDLEIDASLITTSENPIVTAANFALNSGKKIRITGVDLSKLTGFKCKLIETTQGTMNSSILNNIELIDEDGNKITSGTDLLGFSLSSDGKKLYFREKTDGLVITIK